LLKSKLYRNLLIYQEYWPQLFSELTASQQLDHMCAKSVLRGLSIWRELGYPVNLFQFAAITYLSKQENSGFDSGKEAKFNIAMHAANCLSVLIIGEPEDVIHLCWSLMLSSIECKYSAD
jgi:hypothetical protein